MPDATPALIRADRLYCERDDRVLFQNLSFSLDQGQILQIEGPNGSGKTTLIRILCGLSQDFEGDLYWRGQPLSRVVTAFRQASVYFGHHTGVKLALTAQENLVWMAQIKGIPWDRQTLAERMDQALERVGLRGFEDVPLYTLSAGQKRRVALAGLLLKPMPLWILDEPFTAIDRAGVQELEALIVDHALQGGSVILTTHHELSIAPDKLHKLLLGAGSRAAAPQAEAEEATHGI
ncbi:MAG: cytochrome c biogenesis heme-transporting ATPase CcmA [Ketobacteraceae bacterium]|nr:cytochrome c biogenesis heme-transporting ATPase CcmA [Ketobacteraceae bacterium]